MFVCVDPKRVKQKAIAQKKHALNEHLFICACDLSMKERVSNLKTWTKKPLPGSIRRLGSGSQSRMRVFLRHTNDTWALAKYGRQYTAYAGKVSATEVWDLSSTKSLLQRCVAANHRVNDNRWQELLTEYWVPPHLAWCKWMYFTPGACPRSPLCLVWLAWLIQRQHAIYRSFYCHFAFLQMIWVRHQVMNTLSELTKIGNHGNSICLSMSTWGVAAHGQNVYKCIQRVTLSCTNQESLE